MTRMTGVAIVLFCLFLSACIAERPIVPYPSSQERAEAYYGAYPEDYERIVAAHPRFLRGRVRAPIACWAPPVKTAIEWLGKYEYGWGGGLDVWLTDSRGDFLEKASYRYLIRDDRLVVMQKFGFPLPTD